MRVGAALIAVLALGWFAVKLVGDAPSPARAADAVLLETITVSATPPSVATGTVTLTKGTQYTLNVTGTMTTGGPLRLDALFCYGGRAGQPDCDPVARQPASPTGSGLLAGTSGAWLATRIDSFMEASACCTQTAPYQASHEYTVPYFPDVTGKLRLATRDGTANCAVPTCPETTTGSFVVKIFGPAPTTSPPAPVETSPSPPATAPPPTAGPGSEVKPGDLRGKVELQSNEGAWTPASTASVLRSGDRIHTGFKAGVTLTFPDGTRLFVGPMTMIEITDVSLGAGAVRARLWLRLGEVKAEIIRSHGAASDFQIKTPTSTASVRGTKFSVAFDGVATFVAVTESSVEVTANNGKSTIVEAGKAVRSTATAVSKPVKIGTAFKRGGLTSEQALDRISARIAAGLKRCKHDVVSAKLKAAKGGWSASFVIVGASQGAGDKPKGTARFATRGTKVRASGSLGKRILRGCR